MAFDGTQAQGLAGHAIRHAVGRAGVAPATAICADASPAVRENLAVARQATELEGAALRAVGTGAPDRLSSTEDSAEDPRAFVEKRPPRWQGAEMGEAGTVAVEGAKEVVGVVGAGLMGAEIALVHAMAGHDVLLNDRDAATLDRAMDRLGALMRKGAQRGLHPEAAIEPSLRRIRPTADLEDLASADVATEAVFEALDVKAGVLARLDGILRPDCLIATNTSTIPISTLAAALPSARRPHFVGTHYFSPVSRMRLVEVIPGFDTAEAAVERAAALCRGAGKTPIRVKDVAGFAVNRMLHAFIIEAVRLVEEGVATPEDLDTACRLGLGHTMGPFELMDAVTSSPCVQAQEIMQEAYGERFRPPPLLKQRVRAGYGGGKGRPGWRSRGGA